jgi:DNA primase
MAGKIKRQTIDSIFETARIEEVIGDFVQLKKAGSNYKGLSPFTNEKTPSFFVSPAKQIFKCFSTGKGGNVVSFLMEQEHMTYPEALRFLAKKYNIEIEEDEAETPEEKIALNERQNLEVVSKFAQEFFSDSLLNSDEGKAIGLSYFKERGFSPETIDTFQLGYSPDKSNALLDAAKKGQYSVEYLEKAGLIKRSGDRQFDFFKGRVIFPIHNLTGKTIAFGARTLKSDKKVAKYFNSPESELYHKSKVLYGIYQSRSTIVKEDKCYLVEGYTDVISLFQAGIHNVVSSSGTSLTNDQVRLIKRYSSNITILYDGDPAGIKASFRGIDIILEAGMNVKVILFPEGEDPDSYARSVNQEGLKNYLKEEEVDFIVFKSRVLQKEAGDDPVKKTAMVRSILESIALVQDSILRSFYIKECSRLLDVEENSLLLELNKFLRKKHFQKAGQTPLPDAPMPNVPPVQKKENVLSSLRLEEDILIKLLQYGNQAIIIELLDEENNKKEVESLIADYILLEIDSDLFDFRVDRYKLLLDEFRSLEIENTPALQHHFLNHSNEEIRSLTTDILISPYELSAGWKDKHRILTQTEDSSTEVLKGTIERSVFAYKLRNIELIIQDKEIELKKIYQASSSDESYYILLDEVKKLDKARIHFSKKLTRVFSH